MNQGKEFTYYYYTHIIQMIFKASTPKWCWRIQTKDFMIYYPKPVGERDQRCTWKNPIQWMVKTSNRG